MIFKGKSIFKKISLCLLGIGVIGTLGFGATKLVQHIKSDTNSIHPTFEIGSLNAQGRFEEDKSKLYTKDSFRCDGLQAKLDFDSEISYQFFYYDDLGNFMEMTETYTEGESFVPMGTYARCVITPLNDTDKKISFKEKLIYPSQLDIIVSKKQNSKTYNVGNKILVTTDDFNSVKFVHGDFNVGSMTWETEQTSAVTMKQLFDISNFKSVQYLLHPTNTIRDYGLCYIHEFKVVDGNLMFNRVTKLANATSGQADSDNVVFEKDTKYILISCSLIDDENAMVLTESDLVNFNSAFVLK